MKLQVLGSNSDGNCYVLTANSGRRLIIECGLPAKQILSAIDYDVKSVSGLLLSHQHRDHSASYRDMATFGIRVLTSADTLSSIINATHWLSMADQRNMVRHTQYLKPSEWVNVGEWLVMPFEVKHDARCFAYCIKHPEMGTMLFATDTDGMWTKGKDELSTRKPMNIRGVNHWLIEANYDVQLLDRNMMAGRIDPKLKRRIETAHMEIKEAVDAVKRGGLETVRNIVLLHLSDSNSDMITFKAYAERETGKPTYIADAGLTIDLSI